MVNGGVGVGSGIGSGVEACSSELGIGVDRFSGSGDVSTGFSLDCGFLTLILTSEIY
jgi:hypothetical protein